MSPAFLNGTRYAIEMIFLGIDQTGAVFTNGKPKPLPACAFIDNELDFFYLSNFSRFEIEKNLGPLSPSKTKILLDCVLGLPRAVSLPLRKAISSTKRTQGFGRNVAMEFFRTIEQQSSVKKPRRIVEVLARANSVFQEKPFQKNIQTGTFRLWKELSQEPLWYRFPYLGEGYDGKRIPIFEGYPSFSWSALFQVKQRNPKKFLSLFKEKFPSCKIRRNSEALMQKDPNLLDAAVLALHASTLAKSSFSIPKKQPLYPPQEGWILGFPRSFSPPNP